MKRGGIEMITAKALKIIGTATTLLGGVTTLVGSWVDEKKMVLKVEELVAKAIADQKL